LCSSVPAYGMTEFGDGMTIREKHTRVAVWRYRLPSGIFHAAGVGRYLLTIRRQPSSAIHAIRITVHVPPGETVGGDGRTWTRLVPLRTGTATVSVPISGATGHPAALSIEHGPWSDPWLPN